MNLEWKKVESREDIIHNIRNNIAKIDFSNLRQEQRKFEDLLRAQKEENSYYMDYKEIMTIYTSEFMYMLKQKDIPANEKADIIQQFCENFNQKAGLSKEYIDGKSIGSLIEEVFDSFNSQYQIKMVKYLESDDRKMQFMESKKDNIFMSAERLKTIESIKDDDKKMEELDKYVYIEKDRQEIIRTLNRDDEKIEYIESNSAYTEKNLKTYRYIELRFMSFFKSLHNKENIIKIYNMAIELIKKQEFSQEETTGLVKQLLLGIKDDKIVFDLIKELSRAWNRI